MVIRRSSRPYGYYPVTAGVLAGATGSAQRADLASGAAQGMNTMDTALLKAYEAGRITAQTVIDNCTNYDTVSKRINIR